MRRRLSVLMFLQYAVCGAWLPLFSLILQKLDFTPSELAWACATAALGALFAPLPWGQIADRWVPAQHCISFCSFVAGILLWVLSELTTPWPVFLTAFGFWFFMVPVISLGTSLTFRHLQHPERDFGPVRMWGTIGWVAANWLLSFWFAAFESGAANLADAFRLGGSLAFVLTIYAWTLPHSPPSTRRKEAVEARRPGLLWSTLEAPLLAMRLFRQRAFLIYCVCLMGLYITMPFSGQLTPLLLQDLGVATSWLPATLTIAQSLEITTLGLLPIILLRLEIKGTLLLGMMAWAGALAVLTVGRPLGLVIPSLGLHGIYITCFLVAGQVFVNRRAQKDIRASAQALLQFLNGVGMLMGNLLVGSIRSLDPDQFTPSFALAAALAGTLVVLFVAGFRTKTK